MEIKYIACSDIFIAEDRQRKEFNPEEIVSLADSIIKNGLIHPIVLRLGEDEAPQLVAGHRRLKAIQLIWEMGSHYFCAGFSIPNDAIPYLWLGEVDPLDAYEMELEENIRRVDLSWQERSIATSRLHDLRSQQASRKNAPAPAPLDIAKEIFSLSDDDPSLGMRGVEIRRDIMLARNLNDPEVSGAKTAKEAFKVLKRKEQTQRNVELAERLGATFTKHVHKLYQDNCLEWLAAQPAEQFDVILTDPPYGIDADEFSDSGGRAAGAHFYDDSFTNWLDLITPFLTQSFRVAKPQAHMYIFCDIDHFVALKTMTESVGWKVFRTPIIWHKPSGMRAPWPDQGPQRKYEVCLYANKGNRLVSRLYPDLISYPPDDNLGHQAQKPVALFQDLLIRSVRPGDSVLDPFCGSGTIFPAAHALKCYATGVELDSAAYGIAAKRIEDLE